MNVIIFSTIHKCHQLAHSVWLLFAGTANVSRFIHNNSIWLRQFKFAVQQVQYHSILRINIFASAF